MYACLLEGYGEDGEPIYGEHALIDTAALIVAERRASMNNLRRHFAEYKKSQGKTGQALSPPGKKS